MRAKQMLVADIILAQYDPTLPLNLVGDTSAYDGIGAVVSHTFPDGSEQPIACASHTLSGNEKNYMQIEEALSLVLSA